MLKFLVLALLLAGCAGARPRLEYPIGRVVRVQLADVREPQRTWAREELPALDAFRPGWVLVDSSPDVLVRYEALAAPTTLGDFTRNSDSVRLDLTKLHSERAFKSVFAHELVHWFIDAHSTNPARSMYHICEFPYNVSPPVNCHPTIVTRNAMMSEDLPRVPIISPTAEDIQFFDWGMGEGN